MTLVEQPLENIFADELMKGMDFYHMCNNHRASNTSGSNQFPMIRFDIREQLWGKGLPEDDYNLENMLVERFYDDLECYCEGYDELKEFEITTDMNGYRMLLIAPIYDLEKDRDEKEDEIKWQQSLDEPDEEIIDELKEEIAEIDKELVKCAIAYDKFKEVVESLKGYFDDHVVVVDEEGRFDFVHQEWYEDMKEENGWKIWRPEENE